MVVIEKRSFAGGAGGEKNIDALKAKAEGLFEFLFAINHLNIGVRGEGLCSFDDGKACIRKAIFKGGFEAVEHLCGFIAEDL